MKLNLTFVCLFAAYFCYIFAFNFFQYKNLNNTELKYRLPKDVFPIEYQLNLKPFLEEDYFEGLVSIKVNVSLPIKEIYLHSSKLTITKVQTFPLENEVKFELEPTYELIRIYYADGQEFSAGLHKISFQYEGTLIHFDQMGMFKATYQYLNKTEDLLVTEFQPTYARRAFPCFDEPSFKAVFNVSITVPKTYSSYKALANTREIGRDTTPFGVVYKFEATPRISTELLSFSVTNMDFNEFHYNTTKPLIIRTYLGNAKLENKSLVPDFAAKTIRYFENFTRVDYPMGKIDFMEYDKKFTATEYWGLTTFKTGLLNPTMDIYDTRQITIVLAHELTHYWFGNLVTNKWWSDIWLQEGFSQYLSHKVVDFIMNTKNVEEYPFDYIVNVLHIEKDTKYVNPIVMNCTNPREIASQFNDITYNKAGSIIRLMDFISGDELFTKIIRAFFQKFQFKAADTEDFLKLTEQVVNNYNKNGTLYRQFLETWLYQNRFPIITVVEDEAGQNFILTQSSASMHKETDHFGQFGYKWTIPILYTTNKKREPTLVWFEKDMKTLIIPKEDVSYIKLNYNFMGIYFTNYTTEMWENIIDNFQFFTSLEQVQLIIEAGGLFYSDVINCDIPLRLTAKSTFKKQDYYSTLHFTFLLTLNGDLKGNELLQEFSRKIKEKSHLKRKSNHDRPRRSTKFGNAYLKTKNRRNVENNFVDSNENDLKIKRLKVERLKKCSKWIDANIPILMNDLK